MSAYAVELMVMSATFHRYALQMRPAKLCQYPLEPVHVMRVHAANSTERDDKSK